MNKRQYKKSLKRPKEKIKAVVYVDGTNVTDGSKILIYISNSFEVFGEKFCIRNIVQNRKLSATKHFTKGYDYYAFIDKFGNKKIAVDIMLSDTNKSYYEIYPPVIV